MIAPSEHTRGFTLIEVLLVILLLGTLATITIVAIGGQREQAKIDITKQLVETVVPGELEKYNLNIGHYPTEEEGGLKALLTKPDFEKEELAARWAGPYVKKLPKDAWGNELNYELVEAEEGSGKKFKLWSNGPDGESETDDDIKNWSEEEGA